MPADRRAQLEAFLAGTLWADARRTNLAGDASSRHYQRLTLSDGQTAVLMDAPLDAGQDVRPFIEIGTFLSNAGLSAPAILAEDPERGFLLLEDFGDGIFARILAGAPQMELPLYLAATDILLMLRGTPPPPGLEIYDAPRMARLTLPAITCYARADAASGAMLLAEIEACLAVHAEGKKTLALRDYHAENLIWLPDRQGTARVGILDFQDAVLCHPAYDLVSLLEDARRDVSEATRDAVIAHYLAGTGDNSTSFGAAFAALGLQRNLRILGVFARLARQFGKLQYVDLVPRVWAHLERDAAHPALGSVKPMLFDLLPPPDPDYLERLKSYAA